MSGGTPIVAGGAQAGINAGGTGFTGGALPPQGYTPMPMMYQPGVPVQAGDSFGSIQKFMPQYSQNFQTQLPSMPTNPLFAMPSIARSIQQIQTQQQQQNLPRGRWGRPEGA